MSESVVEVKQIDSSPFSVEYERLSKEIRPTFFKPEAVKPLVVSDVKTTPVADSLYEKDSSGAPIVGALLVGTDPSATHHAAIRGEQVNSKYLSTETDGRVVRLDFDGEAVEVSSLHNEVSSDGKSKLPVKDEAIKIPIEGIALKGAGRPFNFLTLIRAFIVL